MFCFHDNGKMRFMKKLEFSPSCIHPYGVIPSQTGTSNLCPLILHPQLPSTLTIHPSLSILHTLTGKEGEEVLQYLLSSHTNQLMVFQDSSLVWAARLDHTPADITVANFK